MEDMRALLTDLSRRSQRWGEQLGSALQTGMNQLTQAPQPIVLLSSRELEKMRRACRLAADLLKHLEPMVRPGVTTQELNDEAERWTRAHGARSAPLGYHGFPKSICTSVNHVVCHGIPSPKQILREGDIINIDVTPVLDGYHGDTSKTFFVGQPSERARRLVEVTEECLRRGIAAVKPGGRVGDIGAAIQEYAEAQGYSVVRDFVGHGVDGNSTLLPRSPTTANGEKGRNSAPAWCSPSSR